MKRLLLSWVLLLLAGCAAYDARVDQGRTLAGVQRFFVLANANDNRGLEHRIVAALQARGLTASAGPHTMMPDDTQVILTYQDHWAWDFGDRLQYLALAARDTRSPTPFATAEFTAKIPGRQTPAAIVDDLVRRLLAGGGR